MKLGDYDGGFAARERDSRGHGLVNGYNSRWAFYAMALLRSDAFLGWYMV